jgi:Predicted exonuclease
MEAAAGRCNLSALEEAVLGKQREDDLPGSLVPQRFFDYLKTGDITLFDDVLKHNLDDVKSLTDILYSLLNAHIRPEDLSSEEDIYSVGRVLEKRGYSRKARTCYRLAERGSMSMQARISLAENLRREKCYEQAAELYRRMIAAGQGGLRPYIALAKLYEHKLSNPGEALRITCRALSIAADRNAPELSDLQKRYIRLIRKQEE